MSQDSPSSVGVVSVSSGSWPWNRMWRRRWRNFSASSETPGNTGSAASALAASGSSVQRVDPGVLRGPVGRRVELRAELVGGELIGGRLEAILGVRVGLVGGRVDRG